MTESSRFWDGIAVGDATAAPYDASEFTEYMSLLFGGYDRTRQGVIFTKRAPYTGLLRITNPSGNIIRMASGAALVDGSLYLNDGNVDIDMGASPTATKHYYLTLTKDWTGAYNGTVQTVRAKIYEIANPGATTHYPDPYYIRGDRCEVLIAYFTMNAGGINVMKDEIRNYINMDFVLADEYGGAHFHGTGRIMCGHGTAIFGGVAVYADVVVQLNEVIMNDQFLSDRSFAEIVNDTAKYNVKYNSSDFTLFTKTFRVWTVDSTVPAVDTEVDFNWILITTYDG